MSGFSIRRDSKFIVSSSGSSFSSSPSYWSEDSSNNISNTNSGSVIINGVPVSRGFGNVVSNIAIGTNSLINNNASGTLNTAVGVNALQFNTTGQNTAFGWSALQDNTTGTFNTAIGISALQDNIDGRNNTSIGLNTLLVNTSGSDNVAVGRSALQNNNGGLNIAIGRNSLLSNTTGTQNTAVGHLSIDVNTTGSNNVGVGGSSLGALTTGSSNTAIGTNAGITTVSGSFNTLIGENARTFSADGSNQIVIGYNSLGQGFNTAFIGGTNGAYNGNNSANWMVTSDIRIKKNIVDNNKGLDIINKIKIKNFEYKTQNEITDLPNTKAVNTPGLQIGVIAQELQQISPECVTDNGLNGLSINTTPLFWYLINSVKELSEKINDLSTCNCNIK